MKILGRVGVFPTIPQSLSRLHELAYNMWWSWNPSAQELYRRLDPAVWESANHSPVAMLSRVGAEKLEQAAGSAEYGEALTGVLAEFDAYLGARDTWFATTYPQLAAGLSGPAIAYFSAEFGLHESLPIYSGGLGVLAGDHCKEASDLGLPYVAVGLLYAGGYFRQTISRDCAQESSPEKLHFSETPATPALTADGEQVLVGVDLPGRRVYARVWQVRVGRVSLYLLDTDVAPNGPADRELAGRLYGGDHELRVAQECILGIGGVRALRALGFAPKVWHMNEGHAAFLGLELVRELVSGAGLDFASAREAVAGSSVFTTHTPVPAGNDVFSFDLMDRYFSTYWGQLGLDRDSFMNLGREETDSGPRFGMTPLALRLSSQHNGVSALHGAVSRGMWQSLWPGADADEVPITHVTNGVHTGTWLAPQLGALYRRALGDEWMARLDQPATWAPLAALPDGDLWRVHQERKALLVEEVRRRARAQRLRQGEGATALAAVGRLLDPRALTIGFARRFATYKRATLLFRDLQRFQRLISMTDRPVQFIFAGKAHPADEPGKALIRQICTMSNDPTLEDRLVFVEGYDMALARYLISGVDVWLNTPRRPLEASGTSGQKASLNGVPNLSVLDGWWAEGYNGRNGWAIGEVRDYRDDEVRAEADSRSLYDLLENEVVPAYYDGRDAAGVPHTWVGIMKEAISTLGPQFSTRRMVKEYATRFYVPAAQTDTTLTASRYQGARDLAGWKAWIYAHWHEIQISAEGPTEARLDVGQAVPITATVAFGSLSPHDVVVELVTGRDDEGQLAEVTATPLHESGPGPDGRRLYRGELHPQAGGALVYGVRVLPVHSSLLHKHELGLVRWA